MSVQTEAERNDMVGLVRLMQQEIVELRVNSRKYLRLKTAAHVYDYDVRQLREMCLRGLIPGATKEGKEWRIPVASLDKMMSENVPARHRRNG